MTDLRHSSAHSVRCTSGSRKLSFVDNVWLWSQLDHRSGHLGSRYFVQRAENNAETVLFTMSFAFVIYVYKAEECNMTWPIAHKVNRCTFWRSCTGLLWKRHFLCIICDFGYSWLKHMQILVGRVLHRGTEGTLRMSYSGCFWFSFCQGIWWRKGDNIVQKESFSTCFMEPREHKTELYTWTNQTLVSTMNTFEHSWITWQPVLVSGPMYKEL